MEFSSVYQYLTLYFSGNYLFFFFTPCFLLPQLAVFYPIKDEFRHKSHLEIDARKYFILDKSSFVVWERDKSITCPPTNENFDKYMYFTDSKVGNFFYNQLLFLQ